MDRWLFRYIIFPFAGDNANIIRYVLIGRLLRLLRLLSVVPGFGRIFGTLRRIVPTCVTFFGMLWCIISMFAALGVTLFGGLIHIGSAPLQDLEAQGTFPET